MSTTYCFTLKTQLFCLAWTGLFGLDAQASEIPKNYSAKGPPQSDIEFDGFVPIYTVGGVTYLAKKYQTGDTCSLIQFSALKHLGTNWTQNVTLYAQTSGIFGCDPIGFQTASVHPLGALPPGKYQLELLADKAGQATNEVFKIYSFAVAEETTPLLRVSPTNQHILEVTAAPVAWYVLEGSTNLTEWRPLATNRVNDPALTKDPLASTNLLSARLDFPVEAGPSSAQFYRVRIEGGEITGLAHPFPPSAIPVP